MAINFDASAQAVLRLYSTPDVVAQRAAILEALALREGEFVVDVGSGPGLMAADAAAAVGADGRVLGLDMSTGMIATARGVASERGIGTVSYAGADAVSLPLPDAVVDAIVCTQVLEYVPDVDAALREFARALRPGGRVAIVDTDWDSVVWNVDDRGRLRRIIAAWDAHCAHPHLPAELLARLRRAGLQCDGPTIVPLVNQHLGTDTYSGLMSRTIAGFAAGRDGVDADETAAFLADLSAKDEAGEYFFALNRFLFVARRPA